MDDADLQRQKSDISVSATLLSIIVDWLGSRALRPFPADRETR